MLKIKFVLVFLFLFIGIVANGQTAKISGKVVDANSGEELIGASVYLKGNTTYGATTDIEGRYVIENVPFGIDTLVVSYISYAQFNEPINITSEVTLTIDVAMVDNVNEIPDIVFEFK